MQVPDTTAVAADGAAVLSTERLVYWLGVALFAVGTLVVLARSRGRPRESEPHYVEHVAVNLWACGACLATAMGQGSVFLAAEQRTALLRALRGLGGDHAAPAAGALADAAGEARRRPSLAGRMGRGRRPGGATSLGASGR